MEPLYFVHLTDTHINSPDKKPYFPTDITAKLLRIFESIGQLKINPSFIVISGDLTHNGDLEDYRFLKQLLKEASNRLGLPIYVALGNHDFRQPFREGYLEEAPSEQSYYYSVIIEGLRLIVLNSQVPGSSEGRVDAEQLAWLKETLAVPAPRGSIAVVHHPVLPTPTSMMDHHLMKNADELVGTLADSDVMGLLSGHIHYNSIGSIHGITCAAATGVAFGLDASDNEYMRFIDNTGYNLVVIKQGNMIVHPMMLPGEHSIMFERQIHTK